MISRRGFFKSLFVAGVCAAARVYVPSTMVVLISPPPKVNAFTDIIPKMLAEGLKALRANAELPRLIERKHPGGGFSFGQKR